MLQINYIRENRDSVIERLAVKNFKDVALIDELIQLDESRRSIQNESDAIAAEANTAAKQIGDLMRQGKKEEAEAIKSSSSGYKEQIRLRTEQLAEVEKSCMINWCNCRICPMHQFRRAHLRMIMRSS